LVALVTAEIVQENSEGAFVVAGCVPGIVGGNDKVVECPKGGIWGEWFFLKNIKRGTSDGLVL
jgi:hypothetical protein